MIITGILLILSGAVAALWAKNTQDSFEYGWYDFWGSSEYEYVDVILYVGIIALIIGIALLIIGCAKKLLQSNNSEQITTGNIQTVKRETNCVNCKAPLDKELLFCPFCGAKQLNEKIEVNEIIAEYYRCRHCGAKLKYDSVFCPECGSATGRKMN